MMVSYSSGVNRPRASCRPRCRPNSPDSYVVLVDHPFVSGILLSYPGVVLGGRHLPGRMFRSSVYSRRALSVRPPELPVRSSSTSAWATVLRWL